MLIEYLMRFKNWLISLFSEFTRSDYIALCAAAGAIWLCFITKRMADETKQSSAEAEKLLMEDFILKHRPYVTAENFGYANSQQQIVEIPGVIIIKVLKSPAVFTKVSLFYYSETKQGRILLDSNVTNKNQVKYPEASFQYTIGCPKMTNVAFDNIPPDSKIIRTVHIEYSWLSSVRSYFFQSEWEYNTTSKTFDIIDQKAN